MEVNNVDMDFKNRRFEVEGIGYDPLLDLLRVGELLINGDTLKRIDGFALDENEKARACKSLVRNGFNIEVIGVVVTKTVVNKKEKVNYDFSTVDQDVVEGVAKETIWLLGGNMSVDDLSPRAKNFWGEDNLSKIHSVPRSKVKGQDAGSPVGSLGNVGDESADFVIKSITQGNEDNGGDGAKINIAEPVAEESVSGGQTIPAAQVETDKKVEISAEMKTEYYESLLVGDMFLFYGNDAGKDQKWLDDRKAATDRLEKFGIGQVSHLVRGNERKNWSVGLGYARKLGNYLTMENLEPTLSNEVLGTPQIIGIAQILGIDLGLLTEARKITQERGRSSTLLKKDGDGAKKAELQGEPERVAENKAVWYEGIVEDLKIVTALHGDADLRARTADKMKKLGVNLPRLSLDEEDRVAYDNRVKIGDAIDYLQGRPNGYWEDRGGHTGTERVIAFLRDEIGISSQGKRVDEEAKAIAVYPVTEKFDIKKVDKLVYYEGIASDLRKVVAIGGDYEEKKVTAEKLRNSGVKLPILYEQRDSMDIEEVELRERIAEALEYFDDEVEGKNIVRPKNKWSSKEEAVKWLSERLGVGIAKFEETVVKGEEGNKSKVENFPLSLDSIVEKEQTIEEYVREHGHVVGGDELALYFMRQPWFKRTAGYNVCLNRLRKNGKLL